MQQQGYRPKPPAAGASQSPQRTRTEGKNGKTRKGSARRKFAGLIIFAALGAAVYFGLAFQSAYGEYKAYSNCFLPNLYIDDIPLSNLTYEQAQAAVLANVNSRQNKWTLSITYNGFTYSRLTYATLGIMIDSGQITRYLDEAWAYGHEGGFLQFRKDTDTLENDPFLAYTTQSEINDDNLDYILQVIAADIELQPKDAIILYFDPNANEPFSIQDESYGLSLDTEAVKQQVLNSVLAGTSGEIEIKPDRIVPNVTRAELEKSVALLSTGKTAIDSASTENRIQNIRNAVSLINGTVLDNGEKFSFNHIVGKRTAENGFLEAPEYAYGILVNGIGGGVCQASTTVYLAALCAGMEITDRSPHAVPVTYTSLGQDATVYYTNDRKIDLSFKNNSGHTVYITAHVEEKTNGSNRYVCVVRIYGESFGDNVYYRLNSVETQLIQAPTEPEYRKDTTQQFVIYTDEKYKVYGARDGHIVATYLQRVENGLAVSEKLVSTDTYAASAALYYVGVKERPQGDN